MQGLCRARPAVVNEQTYGEISETDSVLIVNSRVARGRLDEDVVFLKLYAVAPQGVLRLSQKRNAPEHLGDVESSLDPGCIDSDQFITGANARIIAGAGGRDIGRDNVILAVGSWPVNPGNSIVVQGIRAEMSKAQDTGN